MSTQIHGRGVAFVLAVAALMATALACSGTADTTAADATSQDVMAGQGGGDYSETLYNPDKLVAVDIVLSEADWDFVRQDKRDLTGINFACPKGEVPKGYTWKKAFQVRVDGVEVTNVGIRKKGLIGSVNAVKPSLKLKFDKFVDGQTLLGLERLTLNNNVQDAGHMSQCLTYALSRDAGLAAPRCNFAKVRVNGEELGIYTNVEAVKSRFLKRNFGDKSGDLYEATVADFLEDKTLSFEPKTDDTDTTGAPIQALTDALKLPDDQLMAALEKLVNLDDFCMFWATSLAAGNADSYFTKGNNFFVYFAPSDGARARFIPWGADASFGVHKTTVVGPMARPALAYRLYQHPTGRKRLIAALSKMLTEHWDGAALQSEVERMQALIGALAQQYPYVAVGKDGKPGKAADFKAAVAKTKAFIEGRRALLQALVDNPPTQTAGAPKANCSDKQPTSSYVTSGTFSTEWGSSGAKDPLSTGTANVKVSLAGEGLKVGKTGALAGPESKDESRRVVEVHFEEVGAKGTQHLVAVFSVADKRFVAGGKIPWNKTTGELAGALLAVDSKSAKTSVIGSLSGGVLNLNKASTTLGEAVVGAFMGKWALIGKK